MFLCKVLEDSFRPDTVLVSIMTVNNEIGVRQPIEEIGMLQICLVTSRTLDITSDIPTSLIELLFIVVALGTLTLSVGVRKCIRLITSFRCKNPPKVFFLCWELVAAKPKRWCLWKNSRRNSDFC